MRSYCSRLYGWIGAAFALVAVAFTAGTVAEELAIKRIDTQVSDLADNSLPSVQHLAAARTELMNISRALRSTVEDTTPSASRRAEHSERIQEMVTAFEGEMTKYSQTHWYPGEREDFEARFVPADRLLAEEVAKIEHVENPSANVIALEQEVTSTTDTVDSAIRFLFKSNHDESNKATMRIAALRRQSARMALRLSAIATLVTALAAWVAMHAQRRVERYLRLNAELNAARATELDAFAGRVAHDLLGPLSTVSLSIDMIGREQSADKIREHVKRANRSLARSREMIHGILDFARSGSTPAADAHVGIDATLRSVTDELLATEPSSPPEVVIEPFEDCEVSCEPAVLSSILTNLLSNAFKYTKSCATRRITVRIQPLVERVRVEIEDTGRGVPVGMEESLFEPYVRAPGTGQPGFGLGLATVKRFVTAHRGAVGARRATTGGSLFWFDLPRSQRSAPVSIARPADAH